MVWKFERKEFYVSTSLLLCRESLIGNFHCSSHHSCCTGLNQYIVNVRWGNFTMATNVIGTVSNVLRWNANNRRLDEMYESI